jgi:pyruvate kinase
MSRRAKIVCTLGPATSSQAQLAALVDAGMDVARLNLSHGSREDHLAVFERVREVADAAGRSVGILVDLQGPKIRLGRFTQGSAQLEAGQEFVITTEDVPGDEHEASTTYKGLADDVRDGDRILIDDGNVQLDVVSKTHNRVITRVVVPGKVSNNKGINLPGVAVSAPALTDKDEADLRWGLEHGADMIAMSFVRSAEDAELARKIMAEFHLNTPLMAKIEKPEAVRVLPDVVDAFDGIMVARGDLGVELPLEQVPGVQARAISLARERARPVIVATQMLESMIHAPRPTRAEVSDVASAVSAGADAVMLSAETSVGSYPVETVATMARIVCAAEALSLRAEHSLSRLPTTTGGAIARAATEVAAIVGARALVAFTMTGETARRIARYRSSIPLLAFTSVPATRGQLAFTWGTETFIVPEVRHTDDMVRQVERALLDLGRCVVGDRVVMVAGSPPGTPGKTNGLRVHRIGDAL